MKAKSLLKERRILSDTSFLDLVVWHVPQPVTGSTHHFKYRLAFVVDDVCVIRYDNEAGKGQPQAFSRSGSAVSVYWTAAIGR